MGEPSLFDDLYRVTDPPVSRRAAESVDLNAREQEVVDTMRLLVVPVTADEITASLSEYGIPVAGRNCVARRLTSLARAGRVEACGTKAGRFARAVTLWRLL